MDAEFGLCISGRGAAKIVVDISEELNHNETNTMCQIYCSSIAQCQTSRSKSVDHKICHRDSHQRSPNAPKFEDRSQEETEWQDHWAPEAAWKLAKKILKFKLKHKATFFSPTEKWCLPSLSKITSVGREFVVNSGASMHMISRKDLNSAELESVGISRCPTSIITATGGVQTHEEATAHVKELDMFLRVKILEDTPAVLSLGKLCEDHGYSYEWDNRQRTTCRLKWCFGFNVIRRTTFRSWSQVCLRLPLHRAHQQLQHHYRKNVQLSNYSSIS